MASAEIIRALVGVPCVAEPCGSRVTCSPPPADTDEDWLVELRFSKPGKRRAGNISDAVGYLDSAGFKWEGAEHYQTMIGGSFMSFRRDGLNLIVTADAEFARRHRAATALCRRLNLLNKDDRVALFQAVLYGNVHVSAERGKMLENTGG